jgi:hypothetical protein
MGIDRQPRAALEERRLSLRPSPTLKSMGKWRNQMKKFLLAAAVVIAFATPSHAIYTECTVKKDMDIVNRPGSDRGDPRWPSLQKGENVAIRDSFQSWVFVTFFDDDGSHYGWVQRNALTNCQAREGTP